MNERTYGVVDLFAGPGGLGEGFSAVGGQGRRTKFKIELSVERDSAAHQTLRLRALLRLLDGKLTSKYHDFAAGRIPEPNWKSDHPAEWSLASEEAQLLELGAPEATTLIRRRIDRIRRTYGQRTILIGGPPCQAYSLVGRVRNRGIEGYRPEEDGRHFLYAEYVKILSALRPAAFVMENVKGILSSSLGDGELIFSRILGDLRSAAGTGSYRLIGFAPRNAVDLFGEENKASDFVVRSEEFGVPQARHRVFVIGVRADLASDRIENLVRQGRCHLDSDFTGVESVLRGMPKLRSGLSGGADSPDRWAKAVDDAASMLLDLRDLPARIPGPEFRRRVREIRRTFAGSSRFPRISEKTAALPKSCPRVLRDWIGRPDFPVLPNHETRGHMVEDLRRYLFAAVFAEIVGSSPTAAEFPAALAPDHRNWASGKFADRFRVQVYGRPATTVTSHISKDGHYFIHPDPMQCRSLTVREAARLQTFPDDYLFMGSRTDQFRQVGNAVPPFLAWKIGCFLADLLDRADS